MQIRLHAQVEAGVRRDALRRMRAANSACSLRRCTGKEELAIRLEELAMSVEELAMLHAVRHTCMQHHIGSPPLPPLLLGGYANPDSSPPLR